MISRPFSLNRRQFVELALGIAVAEAAEACASHVAPASPGPLPSLNAAEFRAARRFAEIPFGKIAYVERGSGDAALFLHGAPLNGFQWRGAIDRLSAYRRCIAPDFMGLGYSQVPARQGLAAKDQVAMLASLLDALGVSKVDLIASDSGGAVAQWFMVRYPDRVRTVLLTNCDVEPDSPPPKIMPIIEQARAGTLHRGMDEWLANKSLARSTFGKAVFRDPSQLTDDAIEYYFSPLVSSPLKRTQYEGFHLALDPNPLAGIEPALKRVDIPTRIVWGTSDDLFSPASPDYLDRTLARSQGVRRVPGAKLFFPEEFPELIAEEVRRLWGVST
ncbi:alpha/beta hydrolase [Pendulispora rubella]|uniref:Alpha/beta hydrolase n=1 Tax=Pendulispora rubella TaxID=2741070 RepID=A0ABZ2KUL1_9BACT